MNAKDKNIDFIREFNRFYTNLLGVLDEHILDSDFSLTEARILFELKELGNCKAVRLSSRLSIDKSYLSRILNRLKKLDLISKKTSKDDNRAFYIELTSKGEEVIEKLIEKSNFQLEKLLSPFSHKECDEICDAMKTIKKYFLNANSEIEIRDFKHDDIDYIISRQINLYKSEYGFTSKQWKDYVTNGVKKLVDNFEPQKECIYILEVNKSVSGCIAITKSDDQTAQLRFFFVESSLRQLGVGNKLMEKVLSFCKEKKYKSVILWTFSELFAARHLYDKFGFKIKDTHENNEWGEKVLEECWSLNL